MPAIRDLLWGIVYPALAAGCTWAFLGGAWFKRDARFVSSLAVAAAFLIGYYGLLGALPTVEPEMSGDFATLMQWADGIRRGRAGHHGQADLWAGGCR